MEKINNWLDKLTTFWESQDIDEVVNLFTDDVEYWETPFKKLANSDELRREWEDIKNQQNIVINCKVFSKEGDKYSVLWDLEYKDTFNQLKQYRGIYLVRLNSDNKCHYFFQTCESKT